MCAFSNSLNGFHHLKVTHSSKTVNRFTPAQIFSINYFFKIIAGHRNDFTHRNIPAPAQGSPGTSPGRTSVPGSRGGRHLRRSVAVDTPGPGPAGPAPLKEAARRSDGGMVHSSGPVLRADVPRYFRYRSPGIPGGCRRHPRAAVTVPAGPHRDRW